MIASTVQYLRDEAFPRTSEILKGSELWLALIVGAVSGYWGNIVIPSTTTVGAVSTALLTYGAIALGFCLAGLTLVLTLPSQRFIKRLANSRPARKKHNSYSSLLFVFTWTAVVHWILITLSVVVLVLAGTEQPILRPMFIRDQIMTGIVAGIGAYCLFQFLITLFTLSQVGKLHIDHLQDSAKKSDTGTTER